MQHTFRVKIFISCSYPRCMIFFSSFYFYDFGEYEKPHSICRREKNCISRKERVVKYMKTPHTHTHTLNIQQDIQCMDIINRSSTFHWDGIQVNFQWKKLIRMYIF